MISFYPGPSRVHPDVPKYFKQAYDSGILSINHRDKEFSKLYKETVNLFRTRLNLPKNYSVLFTSSATENWEILSQSLTIKSSVHIYCGAFGQKWFKYSKHIHAGCKAFEFEPNQRLSADTYKIPRNAEMICLTHNETSNGTCLEWKFMRDLRKKFPLSLICVDATSSMAGIDLKWKLADAWFASVQKCFGLPAGMGVLICSPAFIEKSRKIGEDGRYNSFNFMIKNSENWQTPYTPNVASIYLMKRVLENSKSIKEVENDLLNRYEKWLDIFSKNDKLQLHISEEKVRSKRVFAWKWIWRPQKDNLQNCQFSCSY